MTVYRQWQDLDTLVDRIESESERMGDLVDDMLLLARLDQDRPVVGEPEQGTRPGPCRDSL